MLKVAHDLDPGRPDLADMMRMRSHFAAETKAFARQIQEARSKVDVYCTGLQRASEALDGCNASRTRETSPRWQATTT